MAFFLILSSWSSTFNTIFCEREIINELLGYYNYYIIISKHEKILKINIQVNSQNKRNIKKGCYLITKIGFQILSSKFYLI
jgi:hypothetical protein